MRAADRRVGAGGVDHRLLGEPDVGAGGVAEQEEVEGLAGAAGVDVAQHRAGGAEDARRILVVGRHQERGARLAAARPARAARCRRRGRSPSAARAPRRTTQAMLMTKSPSITFSTPVSPPTESTSHIWCTRTAVSSSASATRPSAREPHARSRPCRPAARRGRRSRSALLRHLQRRLRRQRRRGRRHRAGGERSAAPSVDPGLGDRAARRSGARCASRRCRRLRGRGRSCRRRPLISGFSEISASWSDARDWPAPPAAPPRRGSGWARRRRSRRRSAAARPAPAPIRVRATRRSPLEVGRVPAPAQPVGQRDLAARRRRRPPAASRRRCCRGPPRCVGISTSTTWPLPQSPIGSTQALGRRW